MSVDYTLKHGQHESPEAGMCAMEWVAYLANEPHSDSPQCVSPVLQAFGVSFNDGVDDRVRQRLRPYLARMIGTAGDGRDGERAWMATDWLVRVCAPKFMDLTPALREQAEILRGLPPVLNAENAARVIGEIKTAREKSAAAWDAAGAAARDAARNAAWDAAGAAAWDAAWAAAWAAARDAARNAAWDAAGAAAWDAARNAAWDAARDAAWAAAGAALAPTVAELQDSAFDLLDRMLPTETVEIPEASVRELERLLVA